MECRSLDLSGMAKLRVLFGWRNGPPNSPLAPRVSTNRQGVVATNCSACEKMASTVKDCVSVKAQEPVPRHPPFHPPKTNPLPGVAFSVTWSAGIGVAAAARTVYEAVGAGDCSAAAGRDRQHEGRRYLKLEYRAVVGGPAPIGRPVEVPVGGLHQPVRARAVRAVHLSAKAVKRGQRVRVLGGDSKDSARAVSAATRGVP